MNEEHQEKLLQEFVSQFTVTNYRKITVDKMIQTRGYRVNFVSTFSEGGDSSSNEKNVIINSYYFNRLPFTLSEKVIRRLWRRLLWREDKAAQRRLELFDLIKHDFTMQEVIDLLKEYPRYLTLKQGR